MFLRSRSSELVRDTHTGLSSLVWLDSHFFFCSRYRLLVDFSLDTRVQTAKRGLPIKGSDSSMSELPLPLCQCSSALGGGRSLKFQLRESGGLAGLSTGTAAVAHCGLKGAAWFECLGGFSAIWGNFSWLLLRLGETRSQILWTLRGQMNERQKAVFLKGSPTTWTPETCFMTWPLSLCPEILSMASPMSPASFHTSLPPSLPTTLSSYFPEICEYAICSTSVPSYYLLNLETCPPSSLLQIKLPQSFLHKSSHFCQFLYTCLLLQRPVRQKMAMLGWESVALWIPSVCHQEHYYALSLPTPKILLSRQLYI